ncbi:MAG: hypothetical protein HFI17_05680 [Lachnospiraceae bacterium]|nr:hypothetical protein [Lachnospiraceae bacterium]
MDGSLTGDKTKERLGWLDFGKVLGILVVLLVHAEGSPGPVTFYGGMFYMPVFFVAAGYTFRHKEGEAFRVYLKKKAKRLLLPYAGTSAFLWLFFWVKDSLLAGTPGDLKLLSVLGIFYSRNQMYTMAYAGENPVLLNLLNAPLWFLTALLLTSAWYGFADRSRWKYVLLALGAVMAFLWHYGTKLLLPWSLDAVPLFACFMAAGEFLREKKQEKLLGELWFLGLLLVAFITASQLNGSMNLSSGDYGHSILLCLIAGTTGSLLVFAAGMWLEKKCPPLMKLCSLAGQETLTVLCFHMFLFMFIRTGASLLGLPAVLTQILLVVGSMATLTGVGWFWHKNMKR